jgi:GNAT superfamily N-acetyltransferase
VEIRELKINELESLLELYKYLHDQDEILDPKVASVVWLDICNTATQYCWGAFNGDKLVGSCMLAVVPNLTRGGRPYAVIENVVVHSAYRRKGIGGMVLKHALDIAWKLGCYKVMLLTGRTDEAVYKFYESVGFNSVDKTAFVIKR